MLLPLQGKIKIKKKGKQAFTSSSSCQGRCCCKGPNPLLFPPLTQRCKSPSLPPRNGDAQGPSPLRRLLLLLPPPLRWLPHKLQIPSSQGCRGRARADSQGRCRNPQFEGEVPQLGDFLNAVPNRFPWRLASSPLHAAIPGAAQVRKPPATKWCPLVHRITAPASLLFLFRNFDWGCCCVQPRSCVGRGVSRRREGGLAPLRQTNGRRAPGAGDGYAAKHRSKHRLGGERGLQLQLVSEAAWACAVATAVHSSLGSSHTARLWPTAAAAWGPSPGSCGGSGFSAAV